MDFEKLKIFKVFLVVIIGLISHPSFSSIYCSKSFDRTEKISIEMGSFERIRIDDNAVAQIINLGWYNLLISLNVYGEKEKKNADLNESKIVYVESFGRSVICWKEESKTKESQALVIVDMQSSFVERDGNQNTDRNKKIITNVINNIIETIEIAKQRGIYIAIIEFEGYGSTIEVIRNSVKNYDKVKYFTKSTDGMFEKSGKSKDKILSFFIEHQINNIVFTGVNGGACVFASIFDSLRYFKNIYALNIGIADFTKESFKYPYDYGNFFSTIRFFDPPRIGDFKDLASINDLKDVWK